MTHLFRRCLSISTKVPWKTNAKNCLLKSSTCYTARYKSTGSSKLYEFREYDIDVVKVGKFLELTESQLHLRTNHSKLLGYWIVTFGDNLNKVFHIWEYDSYADRAETRAKLGADEHWKAAYVQKAFPYMQRQMNMTMRLINTNSSMENVEPGGCFLCAFYHLRNSTRIDFDEVAEMTEKNNLDDSRHKILGAFISEFGPANCLAVLQHGRSFDDIPKKEPTLIESSKLVQKYCISSRVLGLVPLKVSPLQ